MQQSVYTFNYDFKLTVCRKIPANSLIEFQITHYIISKLRKIVKF